MRLVFAGTPAFAAAALDALLAAGHEVVLVLTQPDRPAGRGMKDRPSEVKTLALERGLALAQPPTLKTDQALDLLRDCKAQAMVVAAYGLLLPQSVLDLYPLGCINIHASLLPRWRGAAPIQRAILAGDSETGISIMQMDAGLDSGAVYLTERVAIEADDTAGTLHDKLAECGARCITQALADIGAHRPLPQPQPFDGVTYARKIEKSEAVIDWSRPAQEIERAVRAFNPVPVANTLWRGEGLRIWQAQTVDCAQATAGHVMEVSDRGVLVGCGRNALLVEELQRAGGKRLAAAEFLRGIELDTGERLGA